jgi:hypothetical protein
MSADLVAHSAGAIIANRAMREVPDLPIKNIVYMAAASSLEDYETTVIGDGEKTGFLALHPQAQVYHLVLHPQAELHEFNWAYGGGLLIPRGSLLDWLDDFLTDPTALRQRMAGKISNLAQRLQSVPASLQDRVHVKVFDFGVPLRTPPSSGVPTELVGWYEWCDEHQNLCQPQKHGDFSEMPFWEPWLIEPKSLAEVSKSGCTD